MKHQLEHIADELILEIKKLSGCHSSVFVAVDGRCAAGKTSLGEMIRKKTDCNVIHMDHFFLRPKQRTKQRLQVPGGNVDYERFLTEVFPQMQKGPAISYQPFDCKKGELGEMITMERKNVIIVEGSYSCHPMLWDCFQLHCFMTVDEKEQIKRILNRDGLEKAETFKNRWIPLEETYFQKCGIKEKCEKCFYLQ